MVKARAAVGARVVQADPGAGVVALEVVAPLLIQAICGARPSRPAEVEADPEAEEARLELVAVAVASEVAPAVEAAPEQVVLAVVSEVAAPVVVRLVAFPRPAAIRASG